MIDRPSFWIVTILLGMATYAIRLSFLAWSQNRPFSERMKRVLDFVPVTVLPALLAPAIVFSRADPSTIDPAKIVAATVALAVGLRFRNVPAVLVSGILALTIAQSIFA